MRIGKILPEPKALSLEPVYVLLGFSALAVLWTWPLAADLSTRLAHDPGDPILNTWFLWWNAQALPFTEKWWNAPMLWPMPGTMALSEHLVGLSIVATPLQLLGARPATAYNICLLLTYALSGFFGYLLARRLTGSRLAAICAGVAFGFSPYRASQLAHIQVLSSQWMPLMLLGLHGYVSTGAVRWLVLFGIAWLVQALSNGYFLLFVPTLIVAWLAWFVDWRRSPRRGLAIVGVWTIASLPLVPILLKYREVHGALGLARSVPGIRHFSAHPESVFNMSPLLRFWPGGPLDAHEQYLFPGATVILLAVVGLGLTIAGRGHRPGTERLPLLFYAAATLLMWVLALGPGGEGDDPASPFYPYSWLLSLPGFDGLRVPARFAMLATLCLAVVAGLTIERLSALAPRWQIVVGAVAIAGFVADGMTHPMPMVTPPGRIILPGPAEGALLELPADDPFLNIAAMYRGMFHRRPLVNGYSGHNPPHFQVLSLSLDRGDTSPLFFLARQRPLVIIVNDALDVKRGFRELIGSVPGIEKHGVSTAGSVFMLPAQAQGREPPRSGPVIPTTVESPGNYRLEFDVGTPQTITALEFPLRRRYDDLAVRLQIETSEDGRTWTEAWAGWTGALAVEATLSDPVRAPIRIALPAPRARYLRIYPASAWMAAETTVHGI